MGIMDFDHLVPAHVSSVMDLTPKVSAPMCWSLLHCCRSSSLLATLSSNDEDDDEDELEGLLICNELSSTGGTVVTSTQLCAIIKKEKIEIAHKRSVTFEDDKNYSFTNNDNKDDINNSQSQSSMNTNEGSTTPNYYDIPDIEKYNNNYNSESNDNAPYETNLIHSSSSSLSSSSPRGGEVKLIQFALLSMLSSGSINIPKKGSISTLTMTDDEYDDTIPDLSLSSDEDF